MINRNGIAFIFVLVFLALFSGQGFAIFKEIGIIAVYFIAVRYLIPIIGSFFKSLKLVKGGKMPKIVFEQKTNLLHPELEVIVRDIINSISVQGDNPDTIDKRFAKLIGFPNGLFPPCCHPIIRKKVLYEYHKKTGEIAMVVLKPAKITKDDVYSSLPDINPFIIFCQANP